MGNDGEETLCVCVCVFVCVFVVWVLMNCSQDEKGDGRRKVSEYPLYFILFGPTR